MRVILTAVGVVLLMLGAVAQSGETQRLRQNKSLIDRAQSEVRKQLAETRVRVQAARGDFNVIDAQVEKAEQELADTRNRIVELREEQKALAAELIQKKKDLGVQEELLKRRVRDIYVQGNRPLVALLLQADSVGDFAVRKALLERIARYDRELFESIEQAQRDIQAQQERNEIILAEIQVLEDHQQERTEELTVLRTEKQRVLASIVADETRLEQQLKQLDEEERNIEQAIKSGTSGSTLRYGGGALLMPVEGGRIGSGFGYRIHPILKTRRMHNGVDIGARTGTPIRAAASGRVVFAGSMRGYGNTIIVDHGSGMSTLYAHCSRLTARNGQNVARGETIALVGSTGLSTGPHLHFEVRINGKPVDPKGYL